MPESSVPSCCVCGEPSKWFCAFCHSQFFCQEHACNHLAKQYPEAFGLKPSAEQKQELERKKTLRFILIGIAIFVVIVLLYWMWSQPSEGSWETLLQGCSTLGKSLLSVAETSA